MTVVHDDRFSPFLPWRRIPRNAGAIITPAGRRSLAKIATFAVGDGIAFLLAGAQRDVILAPLWSSLFVAGGVLAFAYAARPSSPLLWKLSGATLVAGPVGRAVGLVVGGITYGPVGGDTPAGWARVAGGVLLFSWVAWLLSGYVRRMVPDPRGSGRRAPRPGR